MKPKEALSRLNRLQRSLFFKIAASVLLVVLAIAAATTYVVVVATPAAAASAEQAAEMASEVLATPPPAEGEPIPPERSAEDKAAQEAMAKIYGELMRARTSPAIVIVGLSVATAIALIVVWLGLGLTYLALIAAALLVAFPMRALGMPGLSRLLLGVVALTASFTALMQALNLAFSGAGPVLAIARNVLAEAVRMKISLVFIVILIFALAALPGMMDQSTPLRYRVQSFLQFGTGGSYWIIAVLTLFFAAASVAFEQRDKQIWQTMTKPVAPAQYILGKWLGVAGLSAVLLAVCCAGVFLFTEYLRVQPAVGESDQLVSREGGVTEDRRILETQVLAARVAVEPLLPLHETDAEFREGVKSFIEQNRVRDPEFAKDQATYDKVASDLYKSFIAGFRAIEPGNRETYVFEGLKEAKARGGLLMLRYRVDAGSNAPDQLYKITFILAGVAHDPQEVTLGPTHTLTLFPAVIDENGRVEIEIFNGAVLPDPETGSPYVVPNAGTISFPAGGLEISYSAGGYRLNFVRVAVILWIKLAFLAMLAITASTFLSFPVACLVAFSVFLIAESAGFLTLSLEYYHAVNPGEKVIWWKIPVRAIGLTVAWMFRTYSELKPTTKLVDGRLLSFGSMAWGISVLSVWSAALFALATLIFRRRELATYSGQ